MPTLLIVEDELEFSDPVQKHFETCGIEVYAAATGEKGLELFFSKNPAVVLLDLRLEGGMSGIEFLRRVHAKNTSAQIIVVSAIDDQNMMEMAKGLGAVEYIHKPFSLLALEKLVLSRLKRTEEQ